MAPDRGGSTATLNPVPDRQWTTAILNPIPDRGELTAILGEGKQVIGSTTCMGAVVNTEDGNLVICIPISKHATISSTNNSSRCKPIAFSQRGEEAAPAASLARTPVQLLTKTTQESGMGSIAVISTKNGDNKGVGYDSACSQTKVDHHNTIGQRKHSYSTPCKQAISQCTDIKGGKTRPRRTIFRQTDFYQLQNSHQFTNVEATGKSGTCKSVNIEHCNVKQNFSQRNAYREEFGDRKQYWRRNCTDSNVSTVQCASEAIHAHLDCRVALAKREAQVSNWLKAVGPDVECPASQNAEENWPPLLASRTRGETFRSQSKNVSTSCINSNERNEPLLPANYDHENVVLASNIEFTSNSCTASPRVKPELLLDEQIWPFLEKPRKQSVLPDYGTDKKRRTLQPHGSSNPHSSLHGGCHKTENLHIPPLLLMLNKDFIVTSPLKENLLLTLALMGKRSNVEAPESCQGQTTEGETKRQILVGQFKAFSSFLDFMLGRDATRVRTESNAGGTSTISESLSVEYFVRRFQAKDIVTEMEVEYRSFNWKKVDYICTLYGQRVGVSVTRAMSFPDPKDFSAQMAYRLLYKKLFGLVVARHGVSKRHSFSQCILHVWCETQQTARIMQREYDGVSQELDIADDVVMVLTVADGCHTRPIFYESLLRNNQE